MTKVVDNVMGTEYKEVRGSLHQQGEFMPKKKRTELTTALVPIHPDATAIKHVMVAAIGRRDITLDIPTDATLEQVERDLSHVITGYETLGAASERLKPLIGRMLLEIQNRELFKPHFEFFTDFIDERVCKQMGFKRSTAFEALKIARKFPSLTAEEYEKRGASRLLLAAKHGLDESMPETKKTLDRWQKMTVDEVEREIKEEATSASDRAGEGEMIVLGLRVPVETSKLWKSLVTAVQNLTTPDLFLACVQEYIARHRITLKRRGRRTAA